MVKDYGLLNVLEHERAQMRATSLEVVASEASIILNAVWQSGDSTFSTMKYVVGRGKPSVLAEELFNRMTMAPIGTRLVTAE